MSVLLLSRALLLALLHTVCISGQEFGSTIDDDQVLELTVDARDPVKATISMFDVYLDELDQERISLQIKVPVEAQQSDVDARKIYIIDFRQYTPLLNPVVDGRLSKEQISNCSNFPFPDNMSLEDVFESAAAAEDTFFTPELVQEDDSYFLMYDHDGLLSEFNYCSVPTNDSRPGIWSSNADSSGRLTHTAALFVNEIVIMRDGLGNETRYETGYSTTSFKLTWSISQYIIISSLVASQRRVIPELLYASVAPYWDNGVVTDSTVVHITVRTTLENAYHNHLMMVFVSDSSSGVFAVPGDANTQFPARNMPGSGQVPCEAHSNYVLEGLDQDNYMDCQQIWEFDVILPPEVSAYQEIEGVFTFKLQLYECDSLDSAYLDDCGPVDFITEVIAIDLTLDTVVEIVAEQENTLGLEVIAIKNKDNSADFLHSAPLARGIYHREDVVVYVQPTGDLGVNTKAADIIRDHGLVLAAFLVCIHKEVPVGSRMGCLEVDPQYRYIPYMEEDLSVSIQGEMYHRADFEASKQSLATHFWDEQTNNYVIEFKNLALSAKTRLYRMTMIFRLNYTDTPDDATNNGRRKRGLALSQPLTFRKRNTEVNREGNTTETVAITEPTQGNDTEVIPVDSITTELPVSTNVTEEAVQPTTEKPEMDSEDNKESEDNDSDEESDDDEEATALGAVFKTNSCPDGYVFVSTDEPCQPEEGDGPKVGSSRPVLASTSLVMTLTVLTSMGLNNY